MKRNRKGAFKRTIATLLVVLTALSTLFYPGMPGTGTGVARADDGSDLVNETFDALATGTTPSGWGVSVTGSSYVQVVEEDSRRFLQIYDASVQATNGITKTFAQQTGKAVIQADVQLPAGGTPGKDNILFYVLDSANKAAIALNLNADKILSYRTVDGVTTATEMTGIVPGRSWHQLAIAADYGAKTFDLYFDGLLAASAVPFRYDDAVGLSKLQVSGSYSSDTTSNIRIANLDNVLIYTGAIRLQTPPALVEDISDAYAGRSVDLAFADDAAWRAAIADAAVNGTTLSGAAYAVAPGSLQIDGSAFPEAGSYSITVRARGYADATVAQTVNEDPELMFVDETFEALAVGSAPSGWGINATGASSVIVAEAADGNRYLQIVDASRMATQGISKSFPVQTGKLTVEADVQLPPGATSGKENILFYVFDSAGKQAIALNLLPTAIVSLRTTNGSTTSSQLASGLNAGDWRHLTISADYATRTFDFYVDDALLASAVPFRYDDALNLAKLQVTGAYYADDAEYVRLVNLDNVRIYPRAILVPSPEPVVPPAPGVERQSFDSHSSVFLSSRWYWQGGENGQLGTLDALKRFMATDDKWTYETDAAKIGNVVRLGVSFQGTLNMNEGTTGRARYLDGTEIIAPWMVKWNATWGSMSDPVYYELVLQRGKSSIDAGVTSFQFDDWRGSQAAYDMNGDFCEACMTRFRDYLADTYSLSQLAAWGIADIATFDYRMYLQTQLGIVTPADYGTRKTESPLNAPFREFMTQESILFHQRLHDDLEAYAGHSLEFSVNSTIMQYPQTKDHYLHDIFDYEIGESAESSLGIGNIVTFGSLASGLGKPQVISPLPQHPEAIREGIAASYALGQYMLVPWDVWLEGSTRYYGTVADYGDMYHFIRQYPYLFDGYEASARTGVLIDWNELDSAALSELSMRLFEAGVPFRDLVANESLPHYGLQASQFAGLDRLIAYSPLDGFGSADQAVIAASGIPVVAPEDADAAWLAARSAVQIAGDGELYAAVRSREDANAPKVVHLLNRSGVPVDDATLTIADAEFFGSSDIRAVLYRPGRNPLPLELASDGSGGHTLVIPELEEWGIVRVSREDTPDPEAFAVAAPWSGINVGSPAKDGSATASGGTLSVTSEGSGQHVPTTGDQGSADQIAYVYQYLGATPLQDATISARLLPHDSEAPTGAVSGVMIRENAASNARFVAVQATKGSGLELVWRDTDNGAVSSAALGSAELPGYVKLERHNGAFAAYYSADGVTWGAPLGTHSLTMSNPLAGVFAAAGPAGGTNTAVFEALSVTTGDVALPAGELSALRLSGLPESLIAGTASSLTVTAVMDDDGTESEVDVTGEHIVYTSGDPAVATVNRYGTVMAQAAGSATLTASFTHGGVTVTASVAVTVVPPSPYLLDESFDDYDESETPAGWSMTQAEVGGSYIKVAQIPSSEDRSLEAYDNASSGFPSAGAEFAPQTGPITVDFDFQVDFGAVPANGGAIVAYLQAADGATSGVSLLANYDGFWYLDGGTAVVAAPVTPGEWQHIRIVADASTDKMDLYIDGTKVVDQGGFRNAVQSLGKIVVGGSTGGVDTTARWNNVRIAKGAPDTTAPTTTAELSPAEPDGSNGAYAGPVELTLNAVDDASGVADTVYSLNGGSTWLPYDGPIAFTRQGAYTVMYRSTDNAGNIGTVGSVSFTLAASEVEVQLRDSSGNPLTGAVVTYYDGGWKSFGVTGVDGTARRSLADRNYTFGISYEGTYVQKPQNTETDPVVSFATISVKVQLKDSDGQALSGGAATYYAGSWRTFGAIGSGGEASKELLPGTYTFGMTYEGTYVQKSQNTAIDAIIVFQTIRVTVRLLDGADQPLSGGAATYYAGSWRTFGTTDVSGETARELLPGSYAFGMNKGGVYTQQTQNTGSDAIVLFRR
ncbi:hemoblobin-interacting domain-containing protein [Cohnella fermenti]|uniref:DUF1533 domain-containing protein n=1 Tax=Cohnella fermenti TaxID=2565925 RepID=A0A4S4BYG6_9BACL|nr:hemoblobin-interacting domain-containing protein [Cohnella fermenti]THF80304.1 DUF1533 domain-containing protein [Cohnella fermenti]